MNVMAQIKGLAHRMTHWNRSSFGGLSKLVLVL
jgi:hypothetical protein